jgi:YD repeat-containing protein
MRSRQVDPKGIVTRTYFDALNRPVSVVQNLVGQPIGDPNPPAAGVTDTNIRTDTYYDEAGNVIASVDLRGRITRLYYDSANRPYATVKIWWDRIFTTRHRRRVQAVKPIKISAPILSMIPAAVPDASTDPLGRVTKYEYNLVGQLTRVIANYVNGAPQNEENQRNISASFTYDALGRKTSVTDSRITR